MNETPNQQCATCRWYYPETDEDGSKCYCLNIDSPLVGAYTKPDETCKAWEKMIFSKEVKNGK